MMTPRKKPEAKAHLLIRGPDRKVIHRIALSSLNERYVERVISGLLINMRDDCFVDDSEVEAARERQAKAAIDGEGIDR